MQQSRTSLLNQGHDLTMKPSAKDKLLFRLLLENRHRIYAYLFTLIRNRADAEDLLQDTCVTLWEKFDDFDPDTDFIAWSFRVALWKVKNFQRKQGRAKVTFNDELLDIIANRYESETPRLGRRREVLQDCLEKLNHADREFILARYEPGASAQTAAEHSGRNIQAAYKALARIRKRLHQCVTHNLDAQPEM